MFTIVDKKRTDMAFDSFSFEAIEVKLNVRLKLPFQSVSLGGSIKLKNVEQINLFLRTWHTEATTYTLH